MPGYGIYNFTWWDLFWIYQLIRAANLAVIHYIWAGVDGNYWWSLITYFYFTDYKIVIKNTVIPCVIFFLTPLNVVKVCIKTEARPLSSSLSRVLFLNVSFWRSWFSSNRCMQYVRSLKLLHGRLQIIIHIWWCLDLL